MWDYTGPIGPADVGKVAWISGLASEYRGAPQVTVYRIRLAAENDDFKVSDLVATAPIEMDETWAWLLELVASMEDKDYRAVCEKLLAAYGKQFRLIPAAKSMHHGFVGGLLMRFTPAARNPAKESKVTVSGLASSVISAPGSGSAASISLAG